MCGGLVSVINFGAHTHTLVMWAINGPLISKITTTASPNALATHANVRLPFYKSLISSS